MWLDQQGFITSPEFRVVFSELVLSKLFLYNRIDVKNIL